MKITMSSATMNSAGAPAAAETTAVNSAAPAEAQPLDAALAAAAPLPGAALPQAFLRFMQLGGAAPEAALSSPEPAAAPAPGAAAQETEETDGDTLVASMSMPLMPSMMAMPASLPAALRAAAGLHEQPEQTGDAAVAAARGPAQPGLQAQALPEGAGMRLARASAAMQAVPPAQQPAAAAAAVAAPAPVAGPDSGASADGQAGQNAAGPDTGFAIAPAAPNGPAAAPREGALTLSGPPTAWRQSLQEALGERLNLQLGKNAEQATIRLEPPMLGRVEISIRHIAGSLEVNITATHSEVLRQLNTVSDNLRNDLAARQYTDVSVNVSQATPRAQASAQAGAGADAQGRGRQQGQDGGEAAPGAALAEAHQSNTAFSLNGRA